jgi:hypothetical protein
MVTLNTVCDEHEHDPGLPGADLREHALAAALRAVERVLKSHGCPDVGRSAEVLHVALEDALDLPADDLSGVVDRAPAPARRRVDCREWLTKLVIVGGLQRQPGAECAGVSVIDGFNSLCWFLPFRPWYLVSSRGGET